MPPSPESLVNCLGQTAPQYPEALRAPKLWVPHIIAPTDYQGRQKLKGEQKFSAKRERCEADAGDEGCQGDGNRCLGVSAINTYL